MSPISVGSYPCSGCATCCVMCPDVLALAPHTGKAELIDPDQKITEAIRQAAAFCPEKCIILLEAETLGA